MFVCGRGTEETGREEDLYVALYVLETYGMLRARRVVCLVAGLVRYFPKHYLGGYYLWGY